MDATTRQPDDHADDWAAARRELKRAYLLVSVGEIEPAIEKCRRADRRIDGAHHLPETLAGSFQIARGEMREAIATLREVIRAHPEAALPRAHFAEACFFAGRTRQGERALEKARELDDGDHAELIAELETIWKGVDPDEIPPPVDIARTP